MNYPETLAIIGSGPSCIYLLKQLLNRISLFRARFTAIEIFEKDQVGGMGMPYNPKTTDRWNMSNISSEELPELTLSFADWLRGLDALQLEQFGIQEGQIRNDEVYSRLALGEYLRSQYLAIIAALRESGILVQEHTNCKIIDLKVEKERMELIAESGSSHKFDRVVIASGHHWPGEDRPAEGYYASPWPISKLLPTKGSYHNFTIGTLGASLSAVDVVSSLAHRHGSFETTDGNLIFKPFLGTESFAIVMHAGDGLLPHLQYSQKEPLREIARHVSENELLSLCDADGFLRLSTYFDKVCRRVLTEAFHKDGMTELVSLLENKNFRLAEFIQKMTEAHKYSDAFEGMNAELDEAAISVTQHKPMHWKEALDDLMYTLNFYTDLLPAEDHIYLHAEFLPFLMNIIAALPLSSARMLLALRHAGKLTLVTGMARIKEPSEETKTVTVQIDNEGTISEASYSMFVDCSGQEPVNLKEFPWPSLASCGGIRAARAKYQNQRTAQDLLKNQKSKLIVENGQYFYSVSGIDVDRGSHVVGEDGLANHRIADIAFPHIAGIRPYSYGLQACNDTARLLVEDWLRH